LIHKTSEVISLGEGCGVEDTACEVRDVEGGEGVGLPRVAADGEGVGVL